MTANYSKPLESLTVKVGELLKQVAKNLNHHINSTYKLKNEPDHISAIEFSFIPHSGSIFEQNISIYSYSSLSYGILLRKFLETHKSILLNLENLKERINPELIEVGGSFTQDDLQKTASSINIPFSKFNSNSSFQSWIEFLNSKGYGSFALWINLQKDGFSLSGFILFSTYVRLEISLYINQELKNFLEDHGLTIVLDKLKINQLNLKRQATRSAISQVMARNMSHNIGSHVLNGISSEEAIQNILIKDLYEPKYFDFISEYGAESCKEYSHLYKQIAIFNSYLKTMMDFLADVATSTPTVEIPKYLRKDVFRGFAQNFILRNYISGTDDFKYRFEFVVDGEVVNSNDTKDILISMPNDVLGSHALYIIVKNIIRNTAKHSGSIKNILIRDKHSPLQRTLKKYEREVDNIVFTIEINEFKKDATLYEIKIYDNIPKDNIEGLVTDRNRQLNGSILDPVTNDLRSSGGWGLIEMDVCAAYLRMIPIEEVDDEKFDVDVSAINGKYSKDEDSTDWNTLRAIHQDDCLGYRFFMMKPKEVLVVDASENFYDSFNKIQEPDPFKTLLNNGVLIEKPSSEWHKQPPVYAHPFLVYVSSETNKQPEYIRQLINTNHGSLPNKVIAVIDGSETFFASDGLPNSPDRKITYISREVYNEQVCPAIKMIVEGHKEGLEGLKKLLYKLWLSNRYAALGIKTFSCVNRRLKSNSNDIIKIDRMNGEYNFRFDHHGDKISPTIMAHYEAYGSIIKNWTELGFGKVTDDSKWESVNSVYYGIVDSALQNVVIIDERVQKRGGESIYTKTYIELLKWTNIHIPSKYEVDLNSTSFEGTNEKLITWLKTICTYPTTLEHSSGQVLTIPTDEEKYVDFRGVDFCVIHLGIIEKLIKADSKQKDSSKSSEVASFVDETLRCVVGDSCKIIIISGRGRPSNLPGDIPYLNFSIVSQYCFDQKLKFLLTNGLCNARSLKSK